MRKSRCVLACTVALAVIASLSATAGASLVGDTVLVAYTPHPDPSFLEGTTTIPGTIVASAGLAAPINFDFTATQIFLTSPLGIGFPPSGFAFNGFTIDDTTRPFATARINPASNVSGMPTLSLVSGDINLDLQAVQIAPGERLILDVVPEPGSLALFVVGLGAFHFIRRRRPLGRVNHEVPGTSRAQTPLLAAEPA